jgi:hypothetical protein
MMILKKISVFITLLLSSALVFAQEKLVFETIGFGGYHSPLAQVQKDGMKYFYHPQTDVLIDMVDEHAADLLVVVKDGAYGVMHENGKWIISPEYDGIKLVTSYEGQWKKGKEYNYKFILLQKDDSYGFADENGKIIVQPKYQQVAVLSKTLMAFSENGYWGWLAASNGQLLQKPQYDEVHSFFGDNYVQVSLNNKTGLSDAEGRLLIPLEYEGYFTYIFTNTHKYIDAHRQQKNILFDSTGKQVLNIAHESFKTMKNSDLIIFKRNKLFGAADPVTGKEVLAPEFTNLFESVKGLIKVEKNGKQGVIDASGKVIVPVEFSKVNFMNANGQIRYSDEIITAVPEISTQEALSEERKTQLLFEREVEKQPYFIIVHQGNNAGLYNTNGKLIVAPGNHFIETKYNNQKTYIKVSANGKDGFLNQEGKSILPLEYSIITGYPYNDQKLSPVYELRKRYVAISSPAKKTGAIGLFDLEQQKIIVAPTAKYISWLSADLFKVVHEKENYKETISLYNASGILLHQFDETIEDIEPVNNERLRVKQNGLYKLTDLNGRMVYENADWKIRGVYSNVRFPDYRGAADNKFKDDLIKVPTSEGNLFIDKKGTEKRFTTYTEVDHFYDGYALVAKKNNNTKNESSNYLFGVIDQTGKEIIPVQFTNIASIYDRNDLLLVSINEKKGVIARSGTTVVPTQYDEISLQGQGKYFQLTKNGKRGLADRDGHLLLPAIYDMIYVNYEGEDKIWPVLVKNGEWFYFIDKNGKESSGTAKIKK